MIQNLINVIQKCLLEQIKATFFNAIQLEKLLVKVHMEKL